MFLLSCIDVVWTLCRTCVDVVGTGVDVVWIFCWCFVEHMWKLYELCRFCVEYVWILCRCCVGLVWNLCGYFVEVVWNLCVTCVDDV